MPLYEYQCDACGHRFEIIQKFSDAPVDSCPRCQGHVRKLQSAPAFQFKGTGWYITDYAKKDQAATTSDGADQPKAVANEGDKTAAPESTPKDSKGSGDTKAPAAEKRAESSKSTASGEASTR